MRLTTFASGSGGNCALLQSGDAEVLLDAGISLRRIKTALSGRGVAMEELSGVFITHEHTDHVAALKTLIRYYDLPIYAPAATARRLSASLPGIGEMLRVVTPGEPVTLGALSITPFPTSHDTDGSVGYRFDDGEASFALCTDTGVVTDEILEAMCGCGAALIEANHDLDMLRNGSYPYPLKRRILSERGHLSNDASARLACALAKSGARRIVLGHLSRENNTPFKALAAVREALEADGYGDVELYTALQDSSLSLEFEPCCVST